MLKRTIIALVLLLLVASGSLWWFFRPKPSAPKLNETIRAIPVNAAFIIESKHPHSLKQKLTGNNELWKGLSELSFFNTLNSQINSIDSLLLKDPKLERYGDSISLFISAHPGAANSYTFLFTVGIPGAVNTADVEDLIKKNLNTKEIKQRNYDEVTIFSALLTEGKLDYCIRKNVLIMSFSSMLIEDAIRQMNINNSLLNNNTFERLLKTQSATADVNLYVNLNLLPGFLEHFTDKSKQALVYSLRYFNDWVVLDGTVKTDALSFSGFAASSDSVNNFLDVFKGQEPQRIEVFKIIPENTALLLHLGISNFKTYYNSYKKYLETQHKFFDYQKQVDQLKSDYRIDVDKQFLGNIEKEMALLIKTSAADDQSANSYAIFRSGDADLAFASVKAMSDSITKKQKLKRDTAIYHNYSILHLPIHDFLPILLGQSFELVKENYFCKVDNYLVFANSIDALKNLINDFESGRTLENSATFNYVSDNFSSESNVFVYSSFPRSLPMIKGMLDANYTSDWEKSTETLKNIETFALQFSSTATFFYTNIYLKYNANQNETLTPIWETQLDSTISTEPTVVVNHQTKEKELFIQDDANNIYLISNTGKVFWKKHLHEKIMSKIFQIDVKKNNKLQFLFNTESAIYLIDRKGNNVDDFPIDLKFPATNGLNVFDYGDKKDYRIICATENNKIYNYNTKGEQVKQWNVKTNAPVYATVQYVNIHDKDYLVFADASGKVYGLDRQGNEQLSISVKFNSGVKNFSIEKGNSLTETKLIVCDSTGTISSISLAGEKKDLRLKEFESTPLFTYVSGVNDSSANYLFSQGHELSVFSGKNNLMFNFGFKEPVTTGPQLFKMNDGSIFIGITSTTTNELYLFNSNGITVQGFPCFGSTAFCIFNSENLAQPILACGSHNHLIAYSLSRLH